MSAIKLVAEYWEYVAGLHPTFKDTYRDELQARGDAILRTGGWIPVSERVPTKDDADKDGCVLTNHRDWDSARVRHWRTVEIWGTAADDLSMRDAVWQSLPPLPESKHG